MFKAAKFVWIYGYTRLTNVITPSNSASGSRLGRIQDQRLVRYVIGELGRVGKAWEIFGKHGRVLESMGEVDNVELSRLPAICRHSNVCRLPPVPCW